MRDTTAFDKTGFIDQNTADCISMGAGVEG